MKLHVRLCKSQPIKTTGSDFQVSMFRSGVLILKWEGMFYSVSYHMWISCVVLNFCFSCTFICNWNLLANIKHTHPWLNTTLSKPTAFSSTYDTSFLGFCFPIWLLSKLAETIIHLKTIASSFINLCKQCSCFRESFRCWQDLMLVNFSKRRIIFSVFCQILLEYGSSTGSYSSAAPPRFFAITDS